MKKMLLNIISIVPHDEINVITCQANLARPKLHTCGVGKGVIIDC